jgi:hypothetical protein
LRFLRPKSRQKAYEKISFKREAYANECRLDYLKERKYGLSGSIYDL